MDNKFVKLSSLVGGGFSVDKYNGYSFKKWDGTKMLTAQSYVEGYKKSYSFDTDKGQLDLSSAQLGQALEGVFKDGTSTIVGRTFAVKSNGKTGMEIRYYINTVQRDVPVQQPVEDAVADVPQGPITVQRDVPVQQPVEDAVADVPQGPINMDDIPF